MISLKSLSENLLPNIYLKSLTLDSTPITPLPGQDYYNPEDKGGAVLKSLSTFGGTGPPLVTKQTNIASVKMLLSMKFAKSAAMQSDVLALLDSEVKDYISIYTMQFTDVWEYSYVLKTVKTDPNTIIQVYSSPVGTFMKDAATGESWAIAALMKKFSIDEILSPEYDSDSTVVFKNEQLLSDGKTKIVESVKEVNYNFKETDDSFLAYIMFAVIEPPDGHNYLSKPIIGGVSADVVLHNGKLQNEGLIFTIAQPAAGFDMSVLEDYGKPGEIWTGGVHIHEDRFMAGTTHTDASHPFLDYQVVPVNKFVDNRISKKLQKNILNLTSTFEKVNSMFTRYKNNSLNLLDFQQYKNLTFISEIFLSQDSDTNINGFFSIDKQGLLRQKSAFPFIIENINQLIDKGGLGGIAEGGDIMVESLEKLLNLSTRGQLRVYENEKLLGVLLPKNSPWKVNYWLDNLVLDVSPTGAPDLTVFSITEATDDVSLPGSGNTSPGLEHIFFKRISKAAQFGNQTKLKYRVEVEYNDPTVAIVKSIIPKISKVLEDVNSLISEAQIVKQGPIGGLSLGFNEYTQKLNESTVNSILERENPIVTSDGNVISMLALVSDAAFNAYMYNPNDSMEQMQENNLYLNNLSNIKTSTLSHFLTLIKFLTNLKLKIADHIGSAGLKPKTSEGGTAVQNQYAYKKGSSPGSKTGAAAVQPRALPISAESEITINDHGYDFIGYIPDAQTKNNVKTIFSVDYLTAIAQRLAEITKLKTDQEGSGYVDFDSTFKFKSSWAPGTIESLSKNGFSYLPTPNELNALKQSVILPSTVINLSNTKSVKSIFYAIIKHNKELLSIIDQLEPVYKPGTSINELNYILSVGYDTAIKVPSSIQSTDDEPTESSTSGDFGDEPLFVENNAPVNDGAAGSTSGGSSPKFNYNFLKTALINKNILSDNQGLIPNMSKPGFKPNWFMAKHAPVQVKALSIHGKSKAQIAESTGPFKPYLYQSNQGYIQQGVISPKLLHYFWFAHQNIVRVEYLEKYDSINETVYSKNENLDNPYEVGKAITLQNRNIKKPVWQKMTDTVLQKLQPEKKLICRLVKYEQSEYIDSALLKALNLPLMNNYFILQKAPALATTGGTDTPEATGAGAPAAPEMGDGLGGGSGGASGSGAGGVDGLLF